MASAGAGRLALMLTTAVFLTACEEGSEFSLFDKPASQNGETGSDPGTGDATTTFIERDVESPEVFQQTEAGLWDGRPSLGGVWVAHPDVTDPERVIIRNQANGKFVIGALFRRERENPGPRFQVSSDAAASLGMLAGAPAELNVTALRREEVPVVPDVIAPAPDASGPIEQATLDPVAAVEAPAIVEPVTPDPVAAVAASAIDAAEIEAASAASGIIVEPSDLAATGVRPVPRPVTAAAPVAVPAPLPAPELTSTLNRPYIQIGIYSVEANAGQTADMLRNGGIIPTIRKGSSSGKAFWRVLVGPTATSSERSTLIKQVKALGFADAYAVTN